MSAVLEDPSIAKPPLRKPVGVMPATFVTPLVDVSEPIRLHRFTPDELQAMVTHGILAEDGRSEFLDGLVVDKMPRNRRHIITLDLLRVLVESLLPPGWSMQSQEPVAAGSSVPEPDCAVIRGRARDYPDHHPGPADVPLIVEISDSTLRADRGTKLRIYAAAGFENYWIIDLDGDAIITHSQPNPDAEPPSYEDRRIFHRGESVLFELDGMTLTITVADILPPAIQ